MLYKKDGKLYKISDDGKGFVPAIEVHVERLHKMECESCEYHFDCTYEEIIEPKAYLLECPQCKHIQSYGWMPEYSATIDEKLKELEAILARMKNNKSVLSAQYTISVIRDRDHSGLSASDIAGIHQTLDRLIEICQIVVV